MSNNDRAAIESRAQEILEDIDRLCALEDPTPGEIERLDRQTTAAARVRAELEAFDSAKTARQADRDATEKKLRAGGMYLAPGVGPGPEYMKRGAAWDEPLNRQRFSPAEIRDRALAATEHTTGEFVTDKDRERLEKLLRSDKTGEDGIYVQAVSQPAYRGAFQKYLQHGDRAAMFMDEDERKAFAYCDEVRAMSEGSAAAGAALVPFQLDPTIVLTNTGVYPGSIRDISRVVTINTSAAHFVTSAGVSAEWVSEASEATDASPSFTQPTITPVRADCYVQASYELIQDSNISDQLARVFGDAKVRLEETAFATGSGTTQPFGVVTRLAATTASRVAATTNGSFGLVDVYAMDNALPARYQPNASWLSGKWVFNLVRRFSEGANVAPHWTDLGPGVPAILLGHSTYLSAAIFNAGGTTGLSAATASSDDILVIGDFQGFAIVDRIGMSVTVNPVVVGTNRRPTGEAGFLAFWRVGSDVLNTDAFRLLRV